MLRQVTSGPSCSVDRGLPTSRMDPLDRCFHDFKSFVLLLIYFLGQASLLLVRREASCPSEDQTATWRPIRFFALLMRKLRRVESCRISYDIDRSMPYWLVLSMPLLTGISSCGLLVANCNAREKSSPIKTPYTLSLQARTLSCFHEFRFSYVDSNKVTETCELS